ncbi:MAG: CBS domain-containing protein [archaeon]
MSDTSTGVKIRDIMRKTIVTAADTDNIATACKLMDKHDVGSIIVVNKSKKPVGIVTERDVVKRVVAENLVPEKVKTSQVMSKPLMTVDPDIDIAEAMKRMKRFDIRRLVVIEKGEMVGVVSDKDIVDITPALIDVAVEKSRIGAIPVREREPLVGRCDSCGEWSNDLMQIDGKFLCEDCRADKEEEEKIH